MLFLSLLLLLLLLLPSSSCDSFSYYFAAATPGRCGAPRKPVCCTDYVFNGMVHDALLRFVPLRPRGAFDFFLCVFMTEYSTI